MRKIISIIVVVLILAIAGYMIFTGMQYDTSAFILKYELSEDGSSMKITTGTMSTIGYIRDMKEEVSDGTHTLHFYKCWGGFDSNIGARNEFVIELNPDDTQIVVERFGKMEIEVYKNPETLEWESIRG